MVSLATRTCGSLFPPFLSSLNLRTDSLRKTNRPLAYSMLADLIHHVRADLTLSQLSRIVHTYSANVHDPTLGAAIQTMCSKLLLNLIDPISTKDSHESIKVLERVLEAFVSKMEGMAEVRDEWVKWSKVREPLGAVLKTLVKEDEGWKERQREKEKVVEEDTEMVVEGGGVKGKKEKDKDKDKEKEKKKVELDEVDIERAKPIGKATVMVDPGPDPVKGSFSFFFVFVLRERERG